MPKTKSPAQLIADLEAKQAALQERIKREKAKVATQKRKDENRRKIIAGAAVLTHAEQNPQFKEILDHVLNRAVTRKIDREFMGLPGERGKGQGVITLKNEISEAAKA